MAEIRWTEESVRWMKYIHEFILKENPKAADKVVAGIYEKTQILSEFPEIGYVYRCEGNHKIRILVYGHYKITYLIKSLSDVEILGIFHGAMDIDKYIF